SRRLSLGEFASQPGVANDQARRLSGLEPRLTRHSSVLREVKKNLRRHFSFVGISERFDEALLLLGRTLGWRHLSYRPKLVNKNKPDKRNVLPEALNTVAKSNTLDREVFEYARELFDERVKQEGAEFQHDVREFRRENRQYVAALSATRSPT